MSAQIIDGKKIADKIRQDLKKEVANLKQQGIVPKLAVVFVGFHKPSQTYIRKKRDAAQEAGIDFELHNYQNTISKEELIKEIVKIQKDKNLSGLILQLPVPDKLYLPEVLNSINPSIDVDCLHEENIGKLVMGTQYITPPTPTAVIRILKNELSMDLQGKNITLIGAGALVGKPLSVMLSNEQATVTLCNKNTKNIKQKCLEAEIIVTGVGKKDLLTGDMVSPNTVVIDTGIVYENEKMYGDANFEEVLQKASYLTPTPGGVGPITVALLLENVVKCCVRKMNVV